MLASFGAMVRLSLRRSRADWPIVLAAGVICLLATTLLAAGSMYGAAVSTAGLHRLLSDAPAADANIAATRWTLPAEAAAIDAAVTNELERAVGPIGGDVLRMDESESFALPDQPGDEVSELAVLGHADGLEDHADLVTGAWPEDADRVGAEVPVVVSTSVAGALGLEPGERLVLQSRLHADVAVTVAISGIFRITDPSDQFWWGDGQVLDGVVASERYTTHGPFFATEGDLLSRAGPGLVLLGWHAMTDIEAMTIDEIDGLRVRSGEVATRLADRLGYGVVVTTGLPDTLTGASRSLLVSRTSVLLLTVQLVVLAGYAVLLAASLLIEHRRGGSAALRSRGAGRSGLVVLALVEGLLLTVPAALVGPWLAVVALHAFNVAGPLAEIRLPIAPEVTTEAYVAAGVAAAICLAALVFPALRTAGSYSAVPGQLARGQTVGFAQRTGLDIALVAVAAVGLWQLRQYGAPLTRSLQGAVGVDPLLVAAPAIGLLAGAILALRLVPLLARLMERVTARGRGLVPSLGARQIARRPMRYSRAALLLILAMAMGVFAVSYTWTWTASQRDQATFQAGAAFRVEPGARSGTLPRWALGSAYAALPGVTASMPVDRESVQVSRTARAGTIVALDADAAPSIVTMRPDLASEPLADVMAPLAAGRPSIEEVALPGEPRELRLAVGIDIRNLERGEIDEHDDLVFKPADPASIRDWKGIGLAVVVRDARGLLYRFGADPVALGDGAQPVTVALGSGAIPGTTAPAFSYPLHLLAVELSIGLPPRYQSADASISVSGLQTAAADGSWHAASLDLPAGWRTTASYFGQPHQAVASDGFAREPATSVGPPGLSFLPGVDRTGRAVLLTFTPAALERVAGAPIPVVADRSFLAESGRQVGDDLSLTIAGVRRTLRLAGSVIAFPASDPAGSNLVMDISTLELLRYEGNGGVAPPGEWWLAADPADRDAIAAALVRPPLDSLSVIDESELARRLQSDPVALGIVGALAIGFVAATLFAVIGFVVSTAVTARERMTEFALLRALGLSPGQLSGWLSLESASLALVSLAIGTVIGLLLAWVVLPFISVTQSAASPYPPVLVDVPWTAIAWLDGMGIVALVLTLVVLAWLLRRMDLASVGRISED